MSPRRFFLPPEALSGDHASLEGDLASRLSRVLRLKTSAAAVLYELCELGA